MNFSGISGKSRLGKVLRLPLSVIPKDMVMIVLQGKLAGQRWIAGSFNHGCWLGSYEHTKQRAIATLIKPGQTFFDIGANVGFYTLLAARYVGSQGHVVAFEPLPRNIRYLQRHIELNHLTNVTVQDVALSNFDGKAHFHQHKSHAMGKLDPEGNIEVAVSSLDTLLEHKQIPIPDIIKIDVEGAEYDVLLGAQRFMTAHKPVIFLATHGRHVHELCLANLAQKNYIVESLDNIPLQQTSEVVAYKE